MAFSVGLDMAVSAGLFVAFSTEPKQLYDLDNSIIDRMAREHEVFPSWMSPVFSYDPSALRNPVKL